MTDETKAAAGWYPHPSMAGTQRYWDGAAWTDNVAPADPAGGRSPSNRTRHALGWLLVAAVVAGIGFLIPDETEVGLALSGGLMAFGLLVGVISVATIAMDLMKPRGD